MGPFQSSKPKPVMCPLISQPTSFPLLTVKFSWKLNCSIKVSDQQSTSVSPSPNSVPIWMPPPSSFLTEVFDLPNFLNRTSTPQWTFLNKSPASSAVSEVIWTKLPQPTSPTSSKNSSLTSEPLNNHFSRPSRPKELSLRSPKPPSRRSPKDTSRNTWPPRTRKRLFLTKSIQNMKKVYTHPCVSTNDSTM